jgi:hypothetical protein
MSVLRKCLFSQGLALHSACIRRAAMTGASAVAARRSCDSRCEVSAKRVFRNGIARRAGCARTLFFMGFARRRAR